MSNRLFPSIKPRVELFNSILARPIEPCVPSRRVADHDIDATADMGLFFEGNGCSQPPFRGINHDFRPNKFCSNSMMRRCCKRCAIASSTSSREIPMGRSTSMSSSKWTGDAFCNEATSIVPRMCSATIASRGSSSTPRIPPETTGSLVSNAS